MEDALAMKLAHTFLFVTVFAAQATAQARTVFSGIPSVKVSEAGTERVPLALDRSDAVNVACVVSEIGGKFYWATRENTEMVRLERGAFITYVAVNGAGYVRVISPSFKAAASQMSPTEERFDYVEHALIGLRSVTYWGKAK